MKKRVLTMALALLLVFSLTGTALAADTTIGAGGGTGDTTMTYTVASTYTVTIPDAVTINPTTKAGTLTIGVAANPLIESGKSILVKLTTCDFTISYAGDDLTYTITDDASASVTQGSTVLTHGAGTLTASSETLNIAVTDTAKYAGAYTDQITFTVSVE